MESPAKMPAGIRLIAGTILVVAAAVFLLGKSALLSDVDLQRSWPLVVIALGLARLAMTMRSEQLKGWGLLLLGDWLFMNTMTDWAYQKFALALLVGGVDYWIIAGGLSRAIRSSLGKGTHVA